MALRSLRWTAKGRIGAGWNVIFPMTCPKTKVLLSALLLASVMVGSVYHVSIVSGQAVQIKYYPVPTPQGAPRAITVDSEGNVWFTEDNLTINKVGVLTPGNGSIREYAIPSAQAEIRSITVAANGTVWFAEHGANKIGALLPATGRINEWPIFAEDGWGRPEGGIGLDSTGHVWFVEAVAWGIKGIGSVDSLDPRTGNVTKYPTPTCTVINSLNQTDVVSDLTALLVDRYDHVWFTDTNCNWVGRLTPNSRQFTIYPLPYKPQPFYVPGLGDFGGLTVDQVGKLWFTEENANKIGMLNPSTGSFEEWTVPIAKDSVFTPGPVNLALDSKGRIWFTQFCEKPTSGPMRCHIDMLDPASGLFSDYSLSDHALGPWGIAIDRLDNIWFTAVGADSIVELISAPNETSSVTVSTTTANSSVATVTQTTTNAIPIYVPEYPNPATTLAAVMTIVTIATVAKKRRGTNSNRSNQDC